MPLTRTPTCWVIRHENMSDPTLDGTLGPFPTEDAATRAADRLSTMVAEVGHVSTTAVVPVYDGSALLGKVRQGCEAAQLADRSWETEECHRVSGDALCPVCQRPYWQHHTVTPEVPTFRRACDGRLLKL